MFTRFLSSSVGQKILMAITGLLLIGFLIIHLTGNLLIFVGPQAYNEYSHKLISNPLIYVAELILLLLFIGHFVSGILVTLKNRRARPERYTKTAWAGHASHRSISSISMIVTGLVVLVFVPLHLWEFKFGPDYASSTPGVRDLYRLVVQVFQDPLWTAWYVVAMVVVGFHLWHALGSACESLGFRHRKGVRWFGQFLAVVLAGGFLLIPVVIYFTGGKP